MLGAAAREEGGDFISALAGRVIYGEGDGFCR